MGKSIRNIAIVLACSLLVSCERYVEHVVVYDCAGVKGLEDKVMSCFKDLGVGSVSSKSHILNQCKELVQSLNCKPVQLDEKVINNEKQSGSGKLKE